MEKKVNADPLDNRPTWDEYFLNIARLVGSRSSCFRNRVGAIIVSSKDIISTGYNGAPQYQRNCLEIGYCYRDKYKIPSGTQLERCRAVGSHAESNAISLAARNGHSTMGTTMYICGHHSICNQCRANIANAGIVRVVLQYRQDSPVEEFYPEKDWTIHPIDRST